MEPLTANGVSCLDCPGFGTLYRDETECPEDPEHLVDPVFISDVPLGREDDADAEIHTQNVWVYDAQG